MCEVLSVPFVSWPTPEAPSCWNSTLTELFPQRGIYRDTNISLTQQGPESVLQFGVRLFFKHVPCDFTSFICLDLEIHFYSCGQIGLLAQKRDSMEYSPLGYLIAFVVLTWTVRNMIFYLTLLL